MMRMAETFRILMAALLAFCTVAASADGFPSRPVRLITGGAGTFHDIVSRQLGQQLSVHWGQPVVVENQPAAALTVGTGMAARASPDGYTLVMSDRSALTVAPSLYRSVPYDVARDLTPITLVALAPSMLVAHPSVAASTTSELLAELRQDPREAHFATAGPGTNNHIAMEMLRAETGLNLAPVHYKGGGASTLALLSGEVKLGFALLPSVLPHVRSGKLKGYAVTGRHRFPGAPDIPTIAESGIPGLDLDFWIGVLAPAGTPPEVVAKINRDIGDALRQANMQSVLRAQGAEPAPGSQESFAAHIASEASRMRALVLRTGMRAEP